MILSQVFGRKPGLAPRIKWTTPFRRRCANMCILFGNRPSAMMLARIYVAAAIPCATTLLLMEAFLPNIALSWSWLWIVLATPIVFYAYLLVLVLAPDLLEIKQTGIVHFSAGSPTTTRWEDLVGYRVEGDTDANGMATMILYHKNGRREHMPLPQGEGLVPVIVEVGKRIPILDTEPSPPEPAASVPVSGSTLSIMYLLCHVYALGVGYLMVPYLQWGMELVFGILLLGPGTVGAVLLSPRKLLHPKEERQSGLYIAIVSLNMIGSLMTLSFGAIMRLGMIT